MKYLKKFEAWGGRPLPITNVGSLMIYYKCNDCSAIYKTFNKQQSACAYCTSNNLSTTDIENYYDSVIQRLDDQEEIDDLLKQKKLEEEGLIDIIDMGSELNKNNSLRNADKTIWN